MAYEVLNRHHDEHGVQPAMTAPHWMSADLPQDKPSTVRIYDYLLGGYLNFAIYRRSSEQLIAISPEAAPVMQAYCAFHPRAVKLLVEQGIDQFFDLGSIIPMVGSLHKVAWQLWRPDSPDDFFLDQPSGSRTLGGVGRKP